MTPQALKTRYQEIVNMRTAREAWIAAAKNVLAAYGASGVEGLPEHVRGRLEDSYKLLPSTLEISLRFDALAQEAATTQDILDLQRMYLLPDPR